MAIGAKKRTLVDARAALQNAEQEAPARAKAFRRAVSDCARDVEDALRSWSPDPAHVNNLERQATELAALAGRLDAFIREAMVVETQVEALRERVKGLADPALRGALAARCGQWLDKLAALGANVETERDLYNEQEPEQGRPVLADLDSQARLHRQALNQIEESEELIERMGKQASTAVLEAELNSFRVLLIEHGPNPAAIEELERLIGPVRRQANTPPPPPPQPPPTLRELRLLLPEVRQWIRVLGASDTKAQKLTVEIQLIEQRPESWTGPNLSQLADALKAEAEGLREMARQNRETEVKKLGALSRHFVAACGPDPGLETRVANARSQRGDDPPGYEASQESLRQARMYLEGVAQARLADVEKYCSATLAAIETRVRALKTRNISDAVRSDVEAAERKILQLSRAKERDAILDALRESSDLEQTVIELQRQADSDLTNYNSERAAALARLEELSQAARSVEIEIRLPEFPDLSGASLGACVKALETFTADVERSEKLFIETCARLEQTDWEFTVAAARLIGEAGSPIPGGGAEPPQSALDAGQRRAKIRQLRVGAEDRLARTSEQLLARIAEFRERLGAVAIGSEDESQNAADLIEMIDSGAYNDEPDLLERARGLKELLARCESFFWYIDIEKRQALEQFTAVRRRWRRLFDDDLKRYFPKHADRVAGLLNGIPKDFTNHAAVRHQLTEAERILRCIETQGRRLAAAELVEAVRKLTVGMPHMRADERNATQRALDDLQAFGDEFPPAHIRRSIVDTAWGRQRD